MQIIPRAEAKREGLTKYFTGKPCVHGHVSVRWTASGVCETCSAEARKAYKAKNADSIREYMSEWRQRNPEKLTGYAERRDKQAQRDYAKAYRLRDVVAFDAKNKAWKLANADRVLQKRRDRYQHRRTDIRTQRNAYYARNQDRLTAYRRASWERIRSDPERHKEYSDKCRLYYENNIDRVRKYAAEYAKANPGKQRIWSNARRARVVSAAGRGISFLDVQRMVIDQNGACAYCGVSTSALTVDHVVSLNSGGSDDPTNAVMACRPCNSGKRHHDVAVFLNRMTRRGKLVSDVSDIARLLESPWRKQIL